MSVFPNWLAVLLSLRSGIGFPSMGEFVAHAHSRLQANIHMGFRHE
jgi:Trk-type K+ transport system membrane component